MDRRKGTERLADDLAWQHRRVAGRSSAYTRALELLPAVLEGPPGRFLAAAWERRVFHAPCDRPLLLLAALRADARAEGPAHPLFAAFASEPPDVGALSAAALTAALDGSRERVFDALAFRGVSTNDTSRAVAWLWPAALAGASGGARPLVLADVGASAGLNLAADLLSPIWFDETGEALEVATGVRTMARLGLDPSALDVSRDDDVEWLRACVWPGDHDRAARLEASIAAFRTARLRPDGPVLTAVAARNVPGRLDVLSAAERGALVLAYQTLMRDYLEPAEREEYEAGMRGWLAARPPGQALWIELEPVSNGDPGQDDELGAAIVAHARSHAGGAVVTLELARCGFHPRRVVRSAAEVAALRELLAHGAPAHPLPDDR
jgi:hypothetical protein